MNFAKRCFSAVTTSLGLGKEGEEEGGRGPGGRGGRSAPSEKRERRENDHDPPRRPPPVLQRAGYGGTDAQGLGWYASATRRDADGDEALEFLGESRDGGRLEPLPCVGGVGPGNVYVLDGKVVLVHR